MKEQQFPLYKEHKNEHTRALAKMHKVFSEWQENQDINVLKVYFTDVLPKWIVMHIENMDLVAANFFDEY